MGAKKEEIPGLEREAKKEETPCLKWGAKKYGVTFVAPFFINEALMEKLRLYRIAEKYIAFLHGAEPKVQLNKGERRPYVGVVLKVSGFDYFVPMESPKPNHSNIKSGIHLMKINGGEYGLLGFNNMIPVNASALISFDVNNEPDEKYRELLKNQINWCNDNKQSIFDHAQKTYDKVQEGKSAFHIGICCDFKKLEAVSKQYNPNYSKR